MNSKKATIVEDDASERLASLSAADRAKLVYFNTNDLKPTKNITPEMKTALRNLVPVVSAVPAEK